MSGAAIEHARAPVAARLGFGACPVSCLCGLGAISAYERLLAGKLTDGGEFAAAFSHASYIPAR